MNEKGQVWGIVGIVLVLALALVFFGGTSSVPAGSVGLQNTFGDVSAQLLYPGFYFKSPLTAIIPISLQTQKYESKATAASADLQDVITQVTLNYHLDRAKVYDIYTKNSLEFEERIIVPVLQESVKANTARFTATELITERPRVKQAIEDSLKEKLTPYGIVLESISITDFQFSKSFSDAIEAKAKAAQDALRAETELQIAKTNAQQQIASADAQAQSIKLKADADAYALKVVQEQLQKSNELIQYKMIEKWNGALPIYSGQGVPLISLPTSGQ